MKGEDDTVSRIDSPKVLLEQAALGKGGGRKCNELFKNPGLSFGRTNNTGQWNKQ